MELKKIMPFVLIGGVGLIVYSQIRTKKQEYGVALAAYLTREDTLANGWSQNYQLTATEQQQEIRPPFKGLSYYVINDGASELFIQIVGLTVLDRTLRPGESDAQDYPGHYLESIYFWCDKGLAVPFRAVVRG
jgi:hypothetical protein